MEREVMNACAGLCQFLGLAGRCNAVQPAYAQRVMEEQQSGWVDHQTFPLFECMVDGNRWEPYGRDKQKQLRNALQSCERHTTTLLQYGTCMFYYVMLVKRTDGSVVGSQVSVHSGTSRQIRVLLGPGGPRSQRAHTRRGETLDWLPAYARV